MKVTTDACLFGAWAAQALAQEPLGAQTTARLLDIGAGTGLLSLMIAQQTSLQITGIEIDPAAASQAVENIKASPFAGRVECTGADIRGYQAEQKFDIIVSNPPFYEKELRSPDPLKNLAHHGGIALEELLTAIRLHLKAGGIFFLLLPPKREADLLRLSPEQGLRLEECVRVKQRPGSPVIRMLWRGRAESGALPLQETEWAIEDGRQSWSKSFTALLQPYYLRL